MSRPGAPRVPGRCLSWPVVGAPVVWCGVCLRRCRGTPAVRLDEGGDVHADGIFSAIVVGLVLGALGRLVVPGRQAIGMIATILIGLAAGFLGGWIGDKAGWSFVVTLIVQVVLAAAFVGLVAGGMHGGGNGRGRTRSHGRSRIR